jgi:hypothetical protein
MSLNAARQAAENEDGDGEKRQEGMETSLLCVFA